MIRLALFYVCVVSALFAGAFIYANPSGLQAAIVWTAPTTNWPEALWVYKVVPQDFPEPVVSNMMAIGAFTVKDRSKVPAYLSAIDKKAIYFGSDSKHLAICPSLGFIEYHDGNAEARMTEPVIGVPEEDAVLPLALKYLRMAGIDRSQLAVRPDTGRLDLHGEKRDRGYTDKVTGEWTEKIDSRGIFFLRQIDGISVRGIGLHGGVNVRFGNNSNVVDLKICWRNLAPYQLRACPSVEQINGWLNGGQIVLHSNGGGILRDAHKLVITKATIHYDGRPGDEPMSVVFPYVECEANGEGEHGTNTLWFQCPMTLSKDNWGAIK